MKTKLIFSVLATVSCLGHAQEVGRVISSTPVVQQVGVPRQVCTTDQVAVQQPKSGAGALLGAIAGGAVGNNVGRGAGNAAATMLGIVGGAMIGDHIEGAAPAQLQNVQHCSTQTVYESRTTGYNVVYEYAGKQYSVQMPNDPGPTIAIQVAPVGAVPAAVSPPVYTAPTTVVTTPAVTVVPATGYYYQPYYQPYYPPVALDFRWGGGWDRRWR